jgi:hypothetical protein
MFQQFDQRDFIHRIDGDGRICSVNQAWLDFAVENDWDVDKARLLGSDLMASISDLQTRHVYGLLINRVRDSRRSAHFRYRCDSPDCLRLMEMRMHYDATLDQVEFRSRALSIERREPIAVLDTRRLQRSSQTLSVCSWCKAVQMAQAWVELEQAVVRLGLFAADALPRISHGICPDCSKRLATLTAS